MGDAYWPRSSSIRLAGVCVIIFGTVLDYGLTWDEKSQMRIGEAVLRYYRSYFHDGSMMHSGNLFLFGGFFDSLAHLAVEISPLGTYETRHVVNALFGCMGIVATYKLGTYLGGPPAGFFSAVFLTLTPVYYGHLFNNPKDIPFAALNVLSLYYILRSYDALPHAPKHLVFVLGITIGLTREAVS
jgi:asparagine N-glycosylation enzyme membrane subunit Stt3